ncbi:type VII secretion target [Actinopolyspora saharensis]|uniref:Excreted virulence factor EspC, type VII ESX diderm n=1 Tax=Actinopolyspora saharensis TaxID=995062 RepID=A0A1H1GLI4_9ACTN|nr:type VII secretion target [Actinopolyspora saharensis]SDR14045.1 Excreted virulence factor EspC, type VII ESX diderm [Actinopolyspora saharensis]
MGFTTSGSDLSRVAKSFSGSAEEIRSQVQKVADSSVTPDKAGRKFQDQGKAYKEALDRIESNVKSFADYGDRLAQKFDESGKQYQDSDRSGANTIEQVRS